ncbi:MAG: DUF502 domain-containing protein [Burkholderiaceae bacterium]
MFKKFLIAGLLIWLPLAVTVWVLNAIVSMTDQVLLLLPEVWQPDALLGVHVPGLGVVASLAILLSTGVLVANIIGQRMVRWWEGLLNRIPIVRSIYSGVKQVSDTLLSQQGQSFRKVVLVEFPQRGQWTVGFVVGDPGARLSDQLPGEHVTVYVPTAPNPTSGYVIMVRPEEVRELDISVDDAFRFHVSLGVVVPPAVRAGKASALTAPAAPAA